MDIVVNMLTNFVMGFVNLIISPYHIFNLFQLETLKEQMSLLTLIGKSQGLFFAVLALVLVLIGLGIYRRSILRRTVFGLEVFSGKIGHWAAWLTIAMMLQQVLIIAMGQIFRGNELFFAPLGFMVAEGQLQWLSGELKFYNALIIAVASGYTFIEGGHVRVDLVYAATKRRTQLLIDLIGTIVLFIPSTVLLWWFSWPIAMNSMFSQRPLNIWSEKSSWRGFKWESSGTAEFSWVWSFKLMVVIFAGLMFITAIGFLLRNILALLEPEEEIPSHYSFEGDRLKSMGVASMAARSVFIYDKKKVSSEKIDEKPAAVADEPAKQGA